MTAKEELFDFIANLTEEEVDKLVNHFAGLSASLEESLQPCPPEHPLQTA